MLCYFAAFTPVKEGGFAVHFPDIPEALTQGETFQECLENAEDVLSEAIFEYAAARKPLPTPSTLQEAKAYAERNDAGAGESFLQLVQAPGTDTTPVRINVSIPKYVLERIDRKAKALGMNRSRFLSEAALRCAV